MNTSICFQFEPVNARSHLLFNWLNFLYFRKREYANGFSIESSQLISIIVAIPYLIFSEVYFYRQRRYFATIDQQIVGLAAIAEKAEILYVSNLAVSPFYRKIGVATHLLDYATQIARQHRKKTLELAVNKANKPALKLYAKCGFKLKTEKKRTLILKKDINNKNG